MIKLIVLCLLLSSCSLRPAGAHDRLAAAENVQLGFAYLAKSDMVLAKTHFQLALQDQPASVLALDGMAYYYELVGELATAERYYQTALTVKSQRGEAHNNYGTFLCRHERYPQGVHEFLLATKDSHYLHVGGAYSNAAKCSAHIAGNKQSEYYQQLAVLHGTVLGA